MVIKRKTIFYDTIIIPFLESFSELHASDFLQKQGKRTVHIQNYVKLLNDRLWKKDQQENSLKFPIRLY
jgi:hypothetical protein